MRVMTFAFKIEHRVDDVLERFPGPQGCRLP